jgi:CDP-diacylglycerol--glycerol-3-phosphate 3-phosphatidyltransferase|tara:strand:- start:11931 stop:12500 length:570 start_codon:yes stop_codon:yes gene_type:complete
VIAQSHLRAQSKLRKFADALTIGRAIAGLPLILALQMEWIPLAWLLLLLAALSDAIDGWLARRAGGGSSWGARLDPLADKLLLAAPMIWLASTGVLPAWSVWLLLARELLISGWRAQASLGGPASWGGKAKTILQFLSVLLLLWPASWGSSAFCQNMQQLGWWLFWPSLILALSSAMAYIKPQSKPDPH